MKKIEVAAAVLRKNNLIFCAQRKDDGFLSKKWEFPGGKLEIGETPEEALRRELNEELNLDVKVGNNIVTVEHQYPTFHITMHAFFCDIEDQKIVLNEHIDSKWVNADQLEKLDWAEADIPIVNKVKILMKG